MNLIFVDKPGELYDLLSALTIYFDGRVNGGQSAALEASDEAREHIEFLKGYLGDVDENITLFFEARQDKKSFALDELYPILLENVGIAPTWRDFCQLLKPEFLKKSLFRFYLKKGPSADLIGIVDSIEASELSKRLKYQLISFFMDPAPMLLRLQNELERVDLKLQRYRMSQGQKLQECRKDILAMDQKAFLKYVSNIPGHMVRWDAKGEIGVTFCVANRYAVRLETMTPLIILGVNYRQTLRALYQNPQEYDLVRVLNALGHKLRGRLAKRLYVQEGRLGNGAMSLNELSAEQQMNSSTIKYQLSILVNSGMVIMDKSKKQQPRYRINMDCVQFAVRAMNRMFDRGPEISVQEKRSGEAGKWWNS